ncbi:MAG TPA: PAS domain-containing protein, partial [Chthoniobacteraceae bacterium]|nr:PAS domain-containing protein [Chthoniobacteraceae bacterium]
KRAQFELRESESRSRIAMEAARLGSWDWNMGSRVKWSPEHNRMFGLDPDVLEGDHETALAHIHSEDRPSVEKALQRSLTERVDFEAEFRTVDDTGTQRWVAAHGRAYYHEQSGQPVRMIGVVRDVTERRHFEEQLSAKQEELRSALASADVDVLISDIGLPDGDGWQLMRRIGEIKSAQPFGIAMSGYSTRADIEKSHTAGYKHHLIKPFLPEELDVLIAEAASQIGKN